MIKITAVFACTIDGRITDDEGRFSRWGSKEDHTFLHDLILRHDAIIIGRITYEHLVQRPRLGKPMYVLTRNPQNKPSIDGIRFLDPSTTSLQSLFVSNAHFRVLTLGGTKTYSYLLQQDLVDNLYVTVEPFVFGQGKRPFEYEPFTAKRFFLVGMKRLNEKGSLLLHYRTGGSL